MLKSILIGNLGNDAEMRYAQTGTPVLRFNVASNSKVRDQDGEYRDRTEWVRCTIFGNRAESLAPYLLKGTRIYADGPLEARPWTDQQGQVRAGLEMIANEIQLIGDRREGEGGGERPQQRQNGQQQPQRATAGRRPTDDDRDGDDLDSLPF